MRPGAAKCRWLCPIRAQVSVLAERLADPALGELVLADNAFGIDPEQDVYAVPGPLGELLRVDADDNAQLPGRSC